MADTGKTIRASRTNVGGPNVGATPTERSQLVGHEVTQYRSESGLEGLSQVFADFFGTASHALSAVQDGLNYGRKAEIEQENAAQKRQALGDALTGKPMDERLSGDLDYYDAFRAVTAQRDGYSASQEFIGWYTNEWLPENPTGDLMAARQEWAAKNLMGSIDPDYEGQVLASFFDQTDSLIGKHQEFALKYQTAKGMEALGAAIDAEVASGTLTAATLSSFIEKARVLDPLNSVDAPARVMSVLLAAAQNHPSQMMAVSNLLQQDGTGMNGKSFAASWPETFADFQGKAVEAWNSVNTVADLQQLTEFEDRLRFATSLDDLADLGADVLEFREKSGAIGRTGTLLDQIASQAAKLEAQQIKFQGINGWFNGEEGAISASDLRANWTDWLHSNFGTSSILDVDPPTAVSLLQRLNGVVPEDVRTQLSASILDTRNPERAAQALALLNSLSATTGQDYAKSFLNDTAASLYRNVQARAQAMPNEPVENLLKVVQEARDGVKNWDADWKTIIGEPDTKKADQKVKAEIDRVLQATLGDMGFLGTGLFGSVPQIPLTLRESIYETARQMAIEAQANGRGWQSGVEDAILEISEGAELIPGADGQSYLRLGANTSLEYEDGSGMGIRPKLGTNVLNPQTGERVNTVQVFHDQLKELSESNRWALPSGTTTGIALNPLQPPELATAGLFSVEEDGVPILFPFGAEIAVGETPDDHAAFPGMGFQFGLAKALIGDTGLKTVALPDSEEAMDALVQLPEGFKFVRYSDPVYGDAWRLTYRPNFGKQKGLSLDEQIDRFAAENSGGW